MLPRDTLMVHSLTSSKEWSGGFFPTPYVGQIRGYPNSDLGQGTSTFSWHLWTKIWALDNYELLFWYKNTVCIVHCDKIENERFAFPSRTDLSVGLQQMSIAKSVGIWKYSTEAEAFQNNLHWLHINQNICHWAITFSIILAYVKQIWVWFWWLCAKSLSEVL